MPNPAVFERLMKEYLEPANLDPVSMTILRLAASESSTAREMGQVLEENPRYRSRFLKMKILAKRIEQWSAELKPEDPRRDTLLLQRTVDLLGKFAIRNAVLAIRLRRLLPEGTRPGPGGELGGSAQELLACALKAEELCQNEGMAFAHQAFAAGLHYDFLRMLMSIRKAPPDAKPALDAAFRQGLDCARLAYHLASEVRNLELGSFVFGAALLLPLGRALMAVLYPKSLGTASWGAFVAECEKLGSFEDVAFGLREKSRFDLTHAEVGGLFVGSLGLLHPVERAIRFYRSPFYLKNADNEMFRLALILSVAATFTLAKPGQARLSAAHKRALIELPLAETRALAIIQRTLSPDDKKTG